MAGVLHASRGEIRFAPDLRAAYLAQSVALAANEAIASGAVVQAPAPGAQAG